MKDSAIEGIRRKIHQGIQDIIDGKRTKMPWQQNWIGGSPPNNPMTGTIYKGSNVFMLNWAAHIHEYSSNNWVSNGFKDKGARVKREEYSKNEWVNHFHLKIIEDEKTGAIKKIPRSRVWKVWNYDQFEDLGDLPIPEVKKPLFFEPHEQSMKIISDFVESNRSKTKTKDLVIISQGDSAFYNKTEHKIQIPPKESFTQEWDYPHTIFHELIHSTGHPDILNRELSCKTTNKKSYSLEELTAEIGAMYLANIAGLEIEFDNSLSYLHGWLSALDMNPKWIVQAGGKSQQAVNLILGDTE